MIKELFNLLLEEHTQFMEEIYLHASNTKFRKYPDNNIKAYVLFKQYAFEPISIDFDKKGTRTMCVFINKDFGTKVNCGPVEVFYKVISGLNSIISLIIAYNRINDGQSLFSVDKDMVIVKGNINHWFDFNSISNLQTNDIVSTSIDGGEEKLKEIVKELNKSIVDYNKKLLNHAHLICSN